MGVVDVHSHAHRLRGVVGSWPTAIVSCGTQPADWSAVAVWCGEQSGRYASYGIHPWYAETCNPASLAQLGQRLAADPRAGVGEIGLDHARRQADLVQQQACFLAQLQLGCALQRAITVHCVQAWGALLASLDAVDHANARIMVHDYNGSLETARELVGRGVFVSLRLHPQRDKQARLVAGLDPHFLLVESDAGGGAVTEDYDAGVIPDAIGQFAQWRGEAAAGLAAAVYANGERFLGKC